MHIFSQMSREHGEENENSKPLMFHLNLSLILLFILATCTYRVRLVRPDDPPMHRP